MRCIVFEDNSNSLAPFFSLFLLNTQALYTLCFLFFLVPHQVSNHLPFPYLSLTSLSSRPLHYEDQLRFTRSKLIFILFDSFALQKIYITMFNACCTLHENMHCICEANTPRQVQLWQTDVHVHSWSLHRRRVGFRQHLPRNQSLFFYCGKATG